MSASVSAIKTQDAKLKDLGLSKTTVNAEQVNTYSRNLGSVSEDNPVLVLIHGYPQSAYLWRHLIPLLPSNAPLFVPDLPGYGASAPISKNDKLSAGNAILSALQTQVKRSVSSSSSSPIPVVLIGHDRGARVAHRLTVSGFGGINIKGVCLIDIDHDMSSSDHADRGREQVPTITQWKASGRVKESVGFFHWAFLANAKLATDMITAYGGGKWVANSIENWAGTNANGLRSLKADDSIAVYSAFFEDRAIVEASCKDYEAGATTDVELQEQDQKEGRKIKVPLLLVYGKDYIGKRYDVPSEWVDWVQEGVEITDHPLGNGVGHFGAEEAPKESADAVKAWLGQLGVSV
ncbi:alpha/beta-hydrolase [Lophiostoma macrostomum CBS 122681]|uniref:Alpha/beta-hydrolase n=1 Tax=Lophiostoma macrostomum CBS 122681 TaxID=1314788 RepID=A0A6A6TR39_9PLEO|nr:alpha/beta-hydrolase [Lophiostoma macrostomum CBS 122681]